MGFKRKDKEKIIEKKPRESIKIDHIRSTWPRRIGKVILWAFLFLLLIRGVGSIVSGSKDAQQRASIDQYIAAAELRETTRAAAGAFAEEFVRDYYTFAGISGTDYKERVQRYLARSLDIREPPAGTCKTEVKSADAVIVNFISAEHLDIDVNVRIDYIAIGETPVAMDEKELTLRVPIVVKGEEYAVEELPQFVPTPEAADVAKAESYFGTEVASAEKEQMKTFLENFLKTYYIGSASELAYYTTEEFNEPAGIRGKVELQTLRNAAFYYQEESGDYLIDASLTVSDNGRQIDQHLILLAVRNPNDGRYYMRSIKTRV